MHKKNLSIKLHSNSLLIIILMICLQMACKSRVVEPEQVQSKQYELVQTFDNKPIAATNLIRPYKKALDSLMKMPIATAAIPITKALPESLLGNLVTDKIKAYYENTYGIKLHALILNQGGLRIELPQGTITRSMVYELMPFDNELVLFQMKGIHLFDVLLHIAEKGGMPVSGIEMGIKDKSPQDIKIAGKDFDKNANYMIATSDYLFNGGDKFNFSNATGLQYTKLKVRDLIMLSFIAEEQAGKQLSPVLDRRLYYVQ